jgi:Glycosyltransferase family 87
MEGAKLLYGFAGAFVTALLLAKNHGGERWGRGLHAVADVVVLGSGLAFIAIAIYVCARNVFQPLPWDYPIYYTVARHIISGRKFYVPDFYPAVLQEVPAVAQIPEDVHRLVRYVYPPPSALLMVPFGVFTYRASLAAHYIVQGLFLVAAGVLLHRAVPVGKGSRGFAEIVILILAFRPVQNGLAIAQTVFGALLGVAVAFRTIEKHPAVAGMALGIGCFYKQLLVVVGSLTACLRKLGASVAFLVTIASAGLASVVVLGVGVFGDYAKYGQSYNPAESYCGGNYSLFGAVCGKLGLAGKHLSTIEAVSFPEFAGLAGGLALVTMVLCVRTSPSHAGLHLKLSLALAFSLVVFPFVGYYSIALLLPILFGLYSYRAMLPISPWIIIGFIAIQYALVVIPGPGGFVVSLSTWLMVAGMLLFSGAPAVGSTKTTKGAT